MQKIPRILHPKVGNLGQGIVLMILARPDSEIIGNNPRVSKSVQMRLTFSQGISAKMIT